MSCTAHDPLLDRVWKNLCGVEVPELDEALWHKKKILLVGDSNLTDEQRDHSTRTRCQTSPWNLVVPARSRPMQSGAELPQLHDDGGPQQHEEFAHWHEHLPGMQHQPERETR